MQFGYFTLTATSPTYETGCRNPQQFLREVLDEAVLDKALGCAGPPGGHHARGA
jgi:hypothetical protein